MVKVSVKVLILAGAFNLFNPGVGLSLDGEPARAEWNRMLQAKGGQEVLHSVRTMLKTSRTRQSLLRKSDVTDVRVFEFPYRFWWWVDQTGTVLGITTRVVDTEQHRRYIRYGTSPSALPVGTPTTGDELELETAQVVLLLDSAWIHPNPSSISRVGGAITKAIQLTVRVGEHQYVYFVDRNTHLPFKVVRQYRDQVRGFEINTTFELGEYIQTMGVLLPSKVTESSLGGRASVTEHVSYQLNMPHKEGLFDSAPDSVSPDAWHP